MIKVEFPPPDKPWSTNSDRSLHHYERAAAIAVWKGRASLAWTSYCNGLGLDRHMGPALVRVHIPFPVDRRRDPHNYCGTVVKAIVDGLVNAGAWDDDTPEFVEHISPILYKGDMVIIELHEKADARLPCEHGEYVTHAYGKGTTCGEFTTIPW
jgi:Holliday junction resolvase RusA-like endonuclease